jgi:Xaa-Pro aminopeptidase
MADVLVIGDTVRSPELRHEVPLLVPDPFLYAEVDGERHVVVGSMEADRIAGAVPGATVHVPEQLGSDELLASGMPLDEIPLELSVRACATLGLRAARVPRWFPAAYLDRLRAAGLELTVDQPLFDARRRVKSEAELVGIRRAQRAAEAGLAAGVELLRSARADGGELRLDGEPLTVERVKAVVAARFEELGCTSDDFVVAPAWQGAVGHHLGEGPIAPNVPVVFDLWPRDRATACFADMTRTVSVGDPGDEVRAWHRLTREALEAVRGRVRAGAACQALYDAACDVYEAAGYPTQRTKRPGEVLLDGFFHGLGHGVGLEVHEPPYLTRLPYGELVAGDVITLEPGLYRRGVGGVRLEDVVLVTDDGCETLTDASYDLEV